MTRWWLGAYALHATLDPWTESERRAWRERLLALRSIRGLEIPLPDTIDETWLQNLPRSWDYILTLLPATMQSLARQSDFGLASRTAEGRAAAMQLARKAQRAVAAVHEHLGRRAVCAVHLHSGPARRSAAVISDGQNLRHSLEEICTWEWGGADLILEHCDAFRSPETSVKGFLALDEELTATEGLPVAHGVNWGRSVLEMRDVNGALAHVEMIKARGTLRSFIFSGTAVGDPIYGDWQDNHAPISLQSQAVWDPQRGLLTLAEVKKVAKRLIPDPPAYLALKIQPFPTHLDQKARLDCLDAQLAALDQHWNLESGGD